MKKLKIVTICLVIAFTVIQQILRANYYKHLFGEDAFWGSDFRLILNIISTVFVALFDVLTVVLGVMALTTADKVAQDRAYSIFRYVYIMRSIMSFPIVVLETIFYAKYIFIEPVTIVSVMFRHLVWLTLAVLLIMCKPEKPVKKVNLQDYDMVAYTTMSHRFVHYLLDSLFILPTLIFLLQLMSINRFNVDDLFVLLLQVIFLVSYVMYCFFSEVIFRQTMGKIVTRSCVVSEGPPLTIGRIFGRTMARLIPFDPIAFLFGAKWHDSASATSVVYIDSWERAFDEKPQEA
jgi:hypothetical protein